MLGVQRKINPGQGEAEEHDSLFFSDRIGLEPTGGGEAMEPDPIRPRIRAAASRLTPGVGDAWQGVRRRRGLRGDRWGRLGQLEA
jgi:hypothetical protein